MLFLRSHLFCPYICRENLRENVTNVWRRFHMVEHWIQNRAPETSTVVPDLWGDCLYVFSFYINTLVQHSFPMIVKGEGKNTVLAAFFCSFFFLWRALFWFSFTGRVCVLCSFDGTMFQGNLLMVKNVQQF